MITKCRAAWEETECMVGNVEIEVITINEIENFCLLYI
jgi:hypothetical protein